MLNKTPPPTELQIPATVTTLMFIIVIVISLEHCTGVRHYWFVQVEVKFWYSMHSIFRKFNHTQSVRYAQLHHIAQIAEVGVAN